MKKILIIDESHLFREYLQTKFVEKGFEVIEGKNGLDGSVKLRSEMPDLIVMDFYLSRKSSIELLKEKKANPNVANIPVVIASSKVEKAQIVQAAQYGAKKFFTKPVRMDQLLQAIAELLNVEVEVDTTPCVIEAHLNDEILFVEIARGLNTEKIELLKFKIAELLDLYDVSYPRVIVMMSDIELTEDDERKFRVLLDTIIEYAGPYAKHMKVLTKSAFVENFISGDSTYEMIEVTDNLNKAMDDLLGLRPDDIAHDEVVRRKLLSTTKPKKEKDETFQLRFDGEAPTGSATPERPERILTIAVVDDDPIIQQLVKTVFARTGWEIKTYNNGKEFVTNLEGETFDLLFLDLIMPEMDGFRVLQNLQAKKVTIPTIVLSALTQHEAVATAMKMGVHSYLIKPFKPEMLVKKAAEIVNANF